MCGYRSILSLASSAQTEAEVSAGVRQGPHAFSPEEAARIAASSARVRIAPEKARKFVEREELSHSERTCWAAVLGPARYVRLAYEDRGRPHTWCTPTPCAFLSVHC